MLTLLAIIVSSIILAITNATLEVVTSATGIKITSGIRIKGGKKGAAVVAINYGDEMAVPRLGGGITNTWIEYRLDACKPAPKIDGQKQWEVTLTYLATGKAHKKNLEHFIDEHGGCRIGGKIYELTQHGKHLHVPAGKDSEEVHSEMSMARASNAVNYYDHYESDYDELNDDLKEMYALMVGLNKRVKRLEMLTNKQYGQQKRHKRQYRNSYVK